MRNKKAYDKVVRHQTLAKGDRVLVENLGLGGKHKLQSRWNQLPYVVVNKKDLPVYIVKPESGMGRSRVLHRDHLLPIGQTVKISPEEDPLPSMNRPMTRQQRGTCYDGSHNMHFPVSQSVRDDEANSETENEFETCCHETECHETLEKQIPETTENKTFEEELGEVHIIDDTVDLCNGVEGFQDLEKTGGHERSPEPPQLERDDSMNDVEEQIEVNFPRRSQRKVNPVLKLTYDELGNTTDYPLTIVHRGIVIKIG